MTDFSALREDAPRGKRATSRRSVFQRFRMAVIVPLAAGGLAACGNASLPSLGSLTGSTQQTAATQNVDPEIAEAKKAADGITLPPASSTVLSSNQPAKPAGPTALVQNAAIKSGQTPPEAATPQPPADPMAIPLQVAATTARAKRCGFYFQPDQIKTGYLAYEGARGASPKRLSVLEKIYTVAEGRISKAIANEKDYCNEARVAQTRTALQSYIAGNYAYLPPKKKVRPKVEYADNFRERDYKPMTNKDAFGPNWLD